MKYTSIKAVLNRLTIPKDQYDKIDAIEWAIDALDQTNIKNAYEQEMAVIPIKNHRGKLPTGLVQIEVVATPMINKKPSLSELDELEQYEIDYINKSQVDRIDNQGIINNYNLFITTDYWKNNFYILSMTNKPFMGKFHCNDCPNFNSTCEYEYSIDTRGNITTSFESGDLCIGYLKHAIDESGDFLIPDQQDLIQGLAAYIMAKHWEQRLNMKEEGAMNLHFMYMNRAQNLLAKARGIFITKSFDFTDYKNIVYKNIKWANSYSIFNNDYRTWIKTK